MRGRIGEADQAGDRRRDLLVKSSPCSRVTGRRLIGVTELVTEAVGQLIGMTPVIKASRSACCC